MISQGLRDSHLGFDPVLIDGWGVAVVGAIPLVVRDIGHFVLAGDVLRIFRCFSIVKYSLFFCIS